MQVLRDWVFDVRYLRDLHLAHPPFQQRLARNQVHLKKVAGCHQDFEVFLCLSEGCLRVEFLPALCEGLRHRHTHGNLDKLETVFVLAPYLFRKLNALLEV
jgi:hypothetical protein